MWLAFLAVNKVSFFLLIYCAGASTRPVSASHRSSSGANHRNDSSMQNVKRTLCVCS